MLLKVSAKFGIGVVELLEMIVKRVPPPNSKIDNPFRALLFDSWFNQYMVSFYSVILNYKDFYCLKNICLCSKLLFF